MGRATSSYHETVKHHTLAVSFVPRIGISTNCLLTLFDEVSNPGLKFITESCFWIVIMFGLILIHAQSVMLARKTIPSAINRGEGYAPSFSEHMPLPSPLNNNPRILSVFLRIVQPEDNAIHNFPTSSDLSAHLERLPNHHA